MVDLHDVDETAPWRNDPLATRAVLAVRKYNINRRKGEESIKPRQMAVIDYGMVLREIREQHSSNKKFNEEIFSRRLNMSPFDDVRHRAAALAIAKAVYSSEVNKAKEASDVYSSEVNSREKLFEACEAETAPHMATWARKTGLIPVKPRNPNATAQARASIRVNIEGGKPTNRDEISEATGLSDGAVGRATAMEKARLEGIVEGEALALNAQGKLTKAQEKHVNALIKKLGRDLNAQFATAVAVEVNKQVSDRKTSLARAQEACAKQKQDAYADQQRWRKLINGHKPPLTKAEYIDIQWVLRNREPPQERRDRATVAFEDKKLQLTGEK